MYTYDDYLKTAGFIDDFSKGFCPEILIILGSGLNGLADCMEKRASIPYEMIPGFKSSSAPGHMGRLVLGELKGKNVMAMQGRFHAYEGFSFEEIAYPVRTAKVLGADKMIVTNACGAINKSFNVGDIVALRDHINLTGKSPNTGKNLDEFGPRFFDMGECYSCEYISAAEEEAEKLVGKFIFIKKEDAKIKKDEYLFVDLVNCKIIDQLTNEVLGTVIDIYEFPASISLKIKTLDEKIYNIPFIKQFITKVDINNKVIFINNMEGLLK